MWALAKPSKKEQEYIQQLTDMGIWRPAFLSVVHQLVVMENELSRTMREWRRAEPDSKKPSPVQHPLYAVIQAQRKDILAVKDSLGLTPKGLRKLTGAAVPDSGTAPESFGSKLDKLMDHMSGMGPVTLP